MESLTRLVSDSLARHGFIHPVDPLLLQWSPWFRCDTAASLLQIPSQPGILAIAEVANATVREGHDFSRAIEAAEKKSALAAEITLLTILQVLEKEDLASAIDLLFTVPNSLRPLLNSGRCHLRYVTVADGAERRNLCQTLNQDHVGRTLLSGNVAST